MQTASKGFNQMVEREWWLWSKAIQLRRKLWTMAHAKHVDGEAIAVARTNPAGKHVIKLDVQLHEAEQLATPALPFTDPQYIDGIEFDQFGNPVMYDLLRVHPGASNQFANYTRDPERIPAKFVLHWFLMRRPGQHRGIPEMASTLNDGACFRRWREAVVTAAEAAADFAVMLETDMPPGDSDPASPFSAVDFQKGMIVANPMGWKAHQMKAEHPNSTYTEFHRSLVSGQARPKSMPYNVAACDSSSYNYASGRLDYAIWHGSLDVDREDGNDLVLDPLFDLWFDEAIRVFGWLGGDPRSIGLGARSHLWDWPKHKAADIEAEANSIQTRLRSGQATPSGIYAANGDDFTDAIEVMATDYGVTVEQMREALFNANFNATNQLAGMAQAEAQQTQADAAKTTAEKPEPTPAAPQERPAQ
jgi:capsid protein